MHLSDRLLVKIEKQSTREREGHHRGDLLIALILLSIAFSARLHAGNRPLIVDEGKPRAQIIISEKPPRTVRMAAEELQTYIKKMSGAELPISTQAGREWPLHIYIGKSSYTNKLKINDVGLKDGAFRMLSGDDWMVILGGDVDYVPKEPWAHDRGDMKRVAQEWDKITGDHFMEAYQGIFRKLDSATGLWEFDLDNDGAFNGVNQFLRDLGMRWYGPGELGEVVPTLPSIAMPKVDRTIVPDFAWRNMLIYGGNFFTGKKDNILWQMRLGLNQGDLNRGGAPGHGILSVIDRDEMKAAHPDYYLLARGVRQTGAKKIGEAPCLSSEGLFQANVRFLRAVFDQYDFPMYSVMPTDGYALLCECEKCKGKGTTDRGMNGVLSDYVWDYVNRVAKELYKTHPNKKLQCLAYSSYLLPPRNIDKLSPNIIVGIARGSEPLEFYHKLRRDWLQKMAPGNLTWQWGYYIFDGEHRATAGVPAVFVSSIVDDLRDMKNISYGSGIIEVAPNIINDINVYVTARFWWDVNQDLGAMMEEYYKLFYGPARTQMKAFIEFSEANWRKMPNSAKEIDHAFELVNEARKVAGDTIYGRRIDSVIAFMEPMKKMRERLIAASKNIRELKGCVRNEKEVTLDGRLDDPFWKTLPIYELVDMPSKGKPAAASTVRMGWAGDYFYVGIRCEEPQMDKLIPGPSEDGNAAIWESDSVEVMIETQYRSHYQITADPAGGTKSVDWSEQPANDLWPSGVTVATYRGKDFWSAEFRIPITGGDVDLRHGVIGTRPTEDAPWHINICRQRIIDGRKEWSDLSGEPFHDTFNFAKLSIGK